MTSCILFFHHIAKHFSTPSKIPVFICTVRFVSRDICRALLLQLWKSFSSMRTDLPHVCCICDCILAAPVLFFFLTSPVTYFSLSLLSDLADNLVMDDFTLQEQLLTPRLATAGIGGASSPATQLWRSYLVPTLPVMVSILLFCRHWPENPRYRHSRCSQTIKWLKHFFKENHDRCKFKLLLMSKKCLFFLNPPVALY